MADAEFFEWALWMRGDAENTPSSDVRVRSSAFETRMSKPALMQRTKLRLR
jgi:hypothetical protein